jgi:rod shape-determining protein MreC
MLQFFLKKKKFFFLSGLLVVSLTLFARDVEKRKQYNFFDKLLLGLLVPPLKITTLCINKASQIWEEYFYLVDLKKENSFFKDQTEKLEIENQLLREQSIENKRLRELLSFKKRFAYKILPAETIGRDPSSWFKTILIDKGKKDGVMRGSGVITPKGVVGKVINVSNNTSKVLLITDVNSSFDAVVKRSRERGVVEGYSENSCKLSYVLKTEDIKAGDVIVSSGLHNIYPKGVLIGAVSNIIKNKSGFFQFVEIRPSVNFSKLNEVLIVLK